MSLHNKGQKFVNLMNQKIREINKAVSKLMTICDKADGLLDLEASEMLWCKIPLDGGMIYQEVFVLYKKSFECKHDIWFPFMSCLLF